MGLNIYLNFNGTTEEAMIFYAQATGGTIEHMMRFGDQEGMPMPESQKEKIMHAAMEIHGQTVMFSDAGEQHKITMGDNFSMSLDFDNEEDLQRQYDAISAGGTITMPLQDTFWGARFGMCVDKFGLPWMFNHDKPKA